MPGGIRIPVSRRMPHGPWAEVDSTSEGGMPPRALASRVVVVLVTCPKRPVGERIARTLVSEGLAACVNMVPGLTSTYRWQGKICRDSEILLIIKTQRSLLPTLTDRVKALHPYTVPEVIALPLAGGSSAYLAWVTESTG